MSLGRAELRMAIKGQSGFINVAHNHRQFPAKIVGMSKCLFFPDLRCS